MCSFYHKKTIWLGTLGTLLSLGAVAHHHSVPGSTNSTDSSQVVQASAQYDEANGPIVEPAPVHYPNLSESSPRQQLRTLASYHPRRGKSQRELIQAVVRNQARLNQVPETVALGISGHESGGWKMWTGRPQQGSQTAQSSQSTRETLFNINYDPSGRVASTDWGVMQINDQAHPEAFPRARHDVAYNIAYGTALLARTHQVYRGSLNLGFGDWDKTIAAYHLGHAPSAAEMPHIKNYVAKIRRVLRQDQLLAHVHYTVQSGDTLDRIAMKHYGSTDWQPIWKKNRAKLSAPTQLRTGQELLIPYSS